MLCHFSVYTVYNCQLGAVAAHLRHHLIHSMCLCLQAVQPSTGDVLLDCFPDGPSRSELECRVLKINPVEILVPSDLSEQTERLLHSITNAR